MLVQAQNGHIMTFTCGKLGSGVLSDSDDISQFADLKAPKMTLPITKADDSNPEKIVLTFDTSNTTLETGFVSRELGIFAKLDDGTETLYAYSNAGNNYDYIPSKDTPSDENRLVVNLVVSSSASIAVTVDQSIVYAHMSDVVEKITAHDSTSDAHTALAATIDDTIVPKSDTNTIRNLLDNLANRIKAATGASGWKEAPAATLASLSMMIANLATGADVTWDGKKFTNHRLGITGLMDQNGYICFGPNCGNLIIQWGRVSGTPNDYFIWDGTKGYEVKVNTNLPIQFKNSALFAVANILTDAENVVDEKAECCNLGQGTLTLKIASSHQSQSLTACYFILGY